VSFSETNIERAAYGILTRTPPPLITRTVALDCFLTEAGLRDIFDAVLARAKK